MRRALVIGAALLTHAAAIGGGVAIGLAVGGDDAPEPLAAITEAEHDRLLDACMAEASEPTRCLTFVAHIVTQADRLGCGYREAAAVIEFSFAIDASRRETDRYAARTLEDC